MIIITENKTQHYLIKEFLSEVKSTTLLESLRSDQGGEHTPLYGTPRLDVFDTLEDEPGIQDTEVITSYTPVDIKTLEKAAIKKPKMNKLINMLKKYKHVGLIIPMLAASMYFNSNDNDHNVSKIISNNNNIAVEKVQQEINLDAFADESNEAIVIDSDDDVFLDYDKDIEADEVIDELLEDEGFKTLPYPDVKQWSVGYGTRVSDEPVSTFTAEEGTILKAEYLELKGDNKKINKWLNKKYPNWKRDFYKHYNIPKDMKKLDKKHEISKETAIIAAKSSLENVMQKLKTSAKHDFSSKLTGNAHKDIEAYYNYLPKNIKSAMIDMGYNMGIAFTKKFTSFSQGMAVAGMILSQQNLAEADIEMANDIINAAALEILYNFKSDGTIKGPTKYAKDLPKRAMKNYKRITAGINPENITFKTKNTTFQNENYKLKYIYKHLFS